MHSRSSWTWPRVAKESQCTSQSSKRAMADNMDENVTDEEKIRIASSFILHSPPGEFHECFNDVRVLLNDDFLLKEGASDAFAQYNQTQLTPVKIEGSNFPALITEYNFLGDGKFFDPRSGQSFKYDHLHKEAKDFQVYEPDKYTESWRRALEQACDVYTEDHYRTGTSCVFSNSPEAPGQCIIITVCIEDHQFEPKNFWNGKWRSIWTITFNPDDTSAEITGVVKVQVHFYENGNVYLISTKQKEVKENMTIMSEQQLAQDFVQIIEDAETEYQLAISENYHIMADTSFKALRRLLPVTRTKIDWQKILTFKKLGTELKHH